MKKIWIFTLVFVGSSSFADESLLNPFAISDPKINTIAGNIDNYSEIRIEDPSTCIYSFSIGSASSPLILSATDLVKMPGQIADLQIKAASDAQTIDSLYQQLSGAAGELKRLTCRVQDQEMELVSLRQLFRQQLDEIDKAQSQEEKNRMIQNWQQIAFDILFQNTKKGQAK